MRSNLGIIASAFQDTVLPLPASLVARWDAADYTSGQTWSNSTGDTGYDLYLGADGTTSTDDPTFNSGPPANWSFSGSQFFRLKGSNTPLLESWVNTASKGALACCIRTNSSPPTIIGGLLGTYTSGTDGYRVLLENNLLLWQVRGGATLIFNHTLSFTTLTGNKDYLFIVSFDGSVGVDMCLQGGTLTNIGGAYSSTSGNTPGLPLEIASDGSANRLVNGTLMYGTMLFNDVLSQDDVTIIKNWYETTYGITLS